MTINLKAPDIHELKPRITVFGVGGAGGNAVNNMISAGLLGVDFVVANTDAQALTMSKAERIIQMGVAGHRGSRRRLAAGSRPRRRRRGARRDPRSPVGRAYGVRHRRHGRRHRHRRGARRRQVAREMGILTVGVVTKPFQFEGAAPHARRRERHRRTAEGRRHADRSSRTRTCSASPTKRPPSPTPSRWPTRCSIPASPASPI